jgi:hypothetical protein
MSEEFPTLRIIPTSSLVVHELHDDQRTPPLIQKLEQSGILKNPPIVLPLDDKYIVLDGANRTTALTQMGCPHILAQIVSSESLSLDVQTWNHVCWGLDPEDFWMGLRGIEDMRFQKVDMENGLRQLYAHEILILAQRADDAALYAGHCDANDLPHRVDLLHKVMDSYKDRASLDRTRMRRLDLLHGMYENLSGLVVYPPFKVKDVMDLVSQGYLFPAGVTRFTISPRALRVNYPLSELQANKSLETKNKDLDIWIQKKMTTKGVRFYAEPTVLFDE